MARHLRHCRRPEGDLRATLDGMDVGPVHAAADTVKLLAQQPDDGAEQILAARYNTIARCLPGLLKTFTFEASPAGESVLRAIGFVKSLKKQHGEEVQALRDALKQAHGENLHLRRELARRGGAASHRDPRPSVRADHVASIEEPC
ncbi:hypothetical protein [Streptomyces sp. NPDC059460]|uniref:hypothetical protein n=1 Tax=Streptomyces sp. NPDC059460 TaxID=3346840 RepID=UPI003681F5CD